MASSSSPLEIAAERPVSTHKRTYQACIPCRRRKVRCDLGSVDTPHDPPCVRCRREKKDCFFSETRRKRKAEDDGGRETDGLDDDYVIRNRRSQTARNGQLLSGDAASQDSSKAPPVYTSYADTPPLDDQSTLNGNSPSQYPRPSGLSSAGQTPTGVEDQEVTNETAAALFQSPIHNPGDALHLLFEAAGRTGDLDRQSSKGEPLASPRDSKPADKPQKKSDVVNATVRTSLIDPAIDVDPREDKSTVGIEDRDAIQTWSRLRFVRAGWFTALEAMSYIEYYYRHLAPLTPVAPPDFSRPCSQIELLNEEPVLTVTLLTIASRYKKLLGPGGNSRSFMIHDKLWAYLQAMLTRMFWGQEQFGGGFCGAGTSRRGQRTGVNIGGLRNLGTIESLILLSDWHPRSMHFPPGDDGDDILAPLIGGMLESGPTPSVVQSSPHANWIEPVRRSDRMCWSLIGFAYTLAYELGIFDSLEASQTWRPLPGGSHQRENQIGRLLHIYVSQTSGRLGYPNMLPHLGKQPQISYFEMIMPGSTTVDPQLDDDNHSGVQRAWAEMTTLMRTSNDDLFSSKTATRELIRSRKYLELLREYSPRLSNWLTRFGSITVPPFSRTILLIEYEYMRTYINSLSLQAVLEECASAADSSAPGGTPPALLSSTLVNLYKENEPYIAEVVDASRNLLRHVVRGLWPNNGLKHAPVRTQFRILSGAMFLLKSFAVGAKKEEVAISVSLLDDTVKALRSSVVDDVHLILRFADLLENLTASIRHKFVRFAVPGKNANQRNNHSAKKYKQLPKPIAKPNGPGENVKMGPLSDGSDQTVFYEADHDSFEGPLAGIATVPIDPNDSSISIMPPPDFIYSNNANNSHLPYAYSPNSQLYPPQLSPNQSYNPQHSLSQQQQQPYDSGYDWFTLDVNPLISSNYASSNPGVGPAPNIWAGAFGPEISDSLEMLGMLTNGPYSFQGAEGDEAGAGWT